MLDVSEEQAILEIEKAKAELLEQGEDMSKYIISEPEHQKFIVPPTRWTSWIWKENKKNEWKKVF